MYAGGETLGWTVTYPDGTTDPAPYLSVLSAKKAVRLAGGGTIKRITKPAAPSAVL